MYTAKLSLTDDDVRILLSALLEWEQSMLKLAQKDAPDNATNAHTTTKNLYDKLAFSIKIKRGTY